MGGILGDQMKAKSPVEEPSFLAVTDDTISSFHSLSIKSPDGSLSPTEWSSPYSPAGYSSPSPQPVKASQIRNLRLEVADITYHISHNLFSSPQETKKRYISLMTLSVLLVTLLLLTFLL